MAKAWEHMYTVFKNFVSVMLTEIISRNFLSEIITLPRKITDKDLPFSVGFFSPNIVAMYTYCYFYEF